MSYDAPRAWTDMAVKARSGAWYQAQIKEKKKFTHYSFLSLIHLLQVKNSEILVEKRQMEEKLWSGIFPGNQVQIYTQKRETSEWSKRRHEDEHMLN